MLRPILQSALFRASRRSLSRSLSRSCTRLSFSTASAANDPINLIEWIELNKPELKPPVANRLLYGSGQLMVQIVGGPNERLDFHINQGEEYFYQIQGDMQLNVLEGGKFKQIAIKEGEIFVLPGGIPHSPQRFEDTIGLVIERERALTELDGMRWFVPHSSDTLYEEWFHCTDLGKQLAPVINRFKKSKEYDTQKPHRTFNSPVEISTTASTAQPVELMHFLNNDNKQSSGPGKQQHVFGDSVREFMVKVYTNNEIRHTIEELPYELFCHQLKGKSVLELLSSTANGSQGHSIELKEGDTYLLPAKQPFKLEQKDQSLMYAVSNCVTVKN